MKTVILTKGLPGSGKSQWARKMANDNPGKYKLVDKDSLRKLLDDGHWSKTNEKFLVGVRDHVITSALESGYNVIVHDTNFDPEHEQRIRELAKPFGAKVEVKFFDVDVEECIKRDLQRYDSVGEAVIRKMHEKYLATPAEPPDPVPGGEDAIIVDLDGTLALIGDRSPYDAAQCELDILNQPVADVVAAWRQRTQGDVIFMSGRQEAHREPTERWLRRTGIHYKDLFMRATGDQRKDSIVKRELYEEHVKGKYNVAFTIDDREQVVRLWRDELGLTCFQVAWGKF